MDNKITKNRLIEGDTLVDIFPHLKQVNVLADTNYYQDVSNEWLNAETPEPLMWIRDSVYGQSSELPLLKNIARVNLSNQVSIDLAIGNINRWIKIIDKDLSISYEAGGLAIQWYYQDERIKPNRGVTILLEILIIIYGNSIRKPGQGKISVYLWDQPEVFLHEHLRLRLGRLIAILAQEYPYLRFVLRTSDPILFDGIRLSVKEGLLSPDKLGIFFSEDGNTEEIAIDNQGHLQSWPQGFFDTLHYTAVELL